MLAKRMPIILPPLTCEEALETTKIHSVPGVLDATSGLVGARPFRSPRKTVSDAGLIGGGMIPGQGEILLAQNESSSWTNCPSARAPCSKSCASRWKILNQAANAEERTKGSIFEIVYRRQV